MNVSPNDSDGSKQDRNQAQPPEGSEISPEAVADDLGSFDDASVWERLEDVPGAWSSGTMCSRFAALRLVQHKYNEGLVGAGLKMCEGLRLNRRPTEKYLYRCKSLQCPSCWMIAQSKLRGIVKRINAPYWYLRYTNYFDWSMEIDDRVLKRFRARGTELSLVGYILSVERNEDVVAGAEIITATYRFIGIWIAQKLIRHWDTVDRLRPGERESPVHFKLPAEYPPECSLWSTSGSFLGSVSNERFEDRDHCWDEFTKATPHPGHLVGVNHLPEVVRGLRSQYRRQQSLRASKASSSDG